MDTKQHLIGFVTADIVSFIMRDEAIGVEEAMSKFYESEVFTKLDDVETGLYRESSAYVYDLYKIECQYGHLVQTEL
ncbi:MAG: ribonucleotide-diphosphate reductase subunit beta [Spirochaetales bacterium]|jgi:hypothetical protein|nr:ribonucleotide-diphosphate reductase subunit beta [Spirochaetales bacterium]